MTAERDDEKFAQLVDALGPYLARVVIVGGWAHRLFRNHPLAQTLPYAPLMTRDTDVALPTGIALDEENVRERLLSRGFHEEFLGDGRPPVTHYHLGGDDAGFYVEFLTPLVGSEFKRDDTRDVTTTIAGVTAQKLRYLEVLLIAPWSVPLTFGGLAGQLPARINIANPVSYIVQKLLVSGKRKPGERAKDVLYIHDTFEVSDYRLVAERSKIPYLYEIRSTGINGACPIVLTVPRRSMTPCATNWRARAGTMRACVTNWHAWNVSAPSWNASAIGCVARMNG